MNILMLGSKEYPFNSSCGFDRRSGGGIEVHVDKLSKYLSRNGHNVFIVTRRFPNQPAEEKIGDNITVYRTKFLYNKHLRAFTFNMFGFFRALRLIRKEKIDVIHAHAPVAGFFGVLLSKLTGRPVVFTPHGLIVGWMLPTRFPLVFAEKISLRCSDKTLFISPTAHMKLSAGRKIKNVLLTNGIDFDDYNVATIHHNGTRFLFLGRFEEVKGIEYVMEAFFMLSKKDKTSELWLGGDGKLMPHVRHFMESNNLSSRVRILGWVTDVSGVFAQTDVFVLPSCEGGLPIALLEAKASGKAIITSLPFIDDDYDGIYAHARDAHMLYEKMLQLSGNNKKVYELGKNARKSAERLSWDNIVQLFIKEYKSVLPKSSRNLP